MKSDSYFEEWCIHLVLQIHLWGSRHHLVAAGDRRRLRRHGNGWGGGVSVLLLRCGCGWEVNDWLLLLLLRTHCWLVVHCVTHGGHRVGLLLLKDTETTNTCEIQTQRIFTHIARKSKVETFLCKLLLPARQHTRLYVCVCVSVNIDLKSLWKCSLQVFTVMWGQTLSYQETRCLCVCIKLQNYWHPGNKCLFTWTVEI